MNPATNIFAPYHSNHYRYRRVDRCAKINSTDTVCGFLKEVKQSGVLLPEQVILKDFRVRTYTEAMWVLNKLNYPDTRYSSLLNIQSDRQAWQRWGLVPSNLGRGFLFYFICTLCDRRIKNLYMPDGQFIFLCRSCHKLSYPTKQQRLAIQRRLEGVS